MIGELQGRIADRDTTGDAHKVIIRNYLTSKDQIGDVELTSQEGTNKKLTKVGKYITNPKGPRKTIDSNQKLLLTREIKEENGQVIEELTLRNIGMEEEGIPGVRVATLKGEMIETDRYGRYHTPELKNIPEQGMNIMLKVDPATLPVGSRFTTENPRTQWVTPYLMENFDFGVNFAKVKPVIVVIEKTREEDVYETQKVELISSIYYDTNQSIIKGIELDTVEEIAAKLKELNGGTIRIVGNTDSRASVEYNRASGMRRAKALRDELKKILGDKLIEKVSVEAGEE